MRHHGKRAHRRSSCAARCARWPARHAAHGDACAWVALPYGMTSAVATRQVILDYTSPDGKTVTHVRSTLLQSSVQVLKDNGLFDAYLTKLAPRFKDEILLTLAPTWHPLEVAMA